MEDNFLQDDTMWVLPRIKGRDGKKRQRKKNAKKYLKKHEYLRNLYSGEIKIRWGNDKPIRSIYGSAE